MNVLPQPISNMAETPRTPKVAVIAERLSAVRKQAGITQIDMAKKLKVTQSMYSRYERGDARIYADLLVTGRALIVKSACFRLTCCRSMDGLLHR